MSMTMMFCEMKQPRNKKVPCMISTSVPCAEPFFYIYALEIHFQVIEIRIHLLFLSDCCRIPMSRIYPQIIGKLFDPDQGFTHLKVIPAEEIRSSDTTGKQRVSGKQTVPVTDQYRPSGMSGRVING